MLGLREAALGYALKTSKFQLVALCQLVRGVTQS